MRVLHDPVLLPSGVILPVPHDGDDVVIVIPAWTRVHTALVLREARGNLDDDGHGLLSHRLHELLAPPGYSHAW